MKQNLLLTILVSSQIVLAFLLQIIIVRELGAGIETDLYFISLIVPIVVQSIIGWVMASLWLPRLSKVSKNKEIWNSEFQIAHTQIIIITVIFGLLLGFTAKLWFSLFLSSELQPYLEKGVYFVYIILFTQCLSSISEIFIIASRSIGKFVKVELVIVSMMFFHLLASWFALSIWGIEAVLWLWLLKALIVYLIFLFTSGTGKFVINRKLVTRRYWLLSSHLLAGGSIYKTAPLVDRYWAAQAYVGGLTLFSLAFSIMNAMSTIIQRAFSIPLIPVISRLIQQNKYREFISLYRRFFTRAAVICSSLLLMGIIFKAEMIDIAVIVLGLPEEQLEVMWLLGVCLSVYVFASSVGLLTVNAFYAMNDTITPTLIGVGGFCISLITKSMAFIYFGLPGLAVSISIYYLINMIVLNFLLKRTFIKFSKSIATTEF